MTTVVAFDLDGTVVAYEALGQEWYARACDRVGVAHDEAAWEGFIDRLIDVFLDVEDPYRVAAAEVAAEQGLGVTGERLGEALKDVEVELSYVPDPVARTLDDLADYPLAVLTNGHGPLQRRKLRELGVADHFETVIGSTDVGAAKPDPAAFHALRNDLGATLGATAVDRWVYVGDHPEKDFAARRHGFDVAILGDYPEAGDPTLHLADHDEFERITRLVG